ncbi:MAG TPA: hypothetical protein VH518_25655 [Tepidisphaeraceae bacterium]
MNFFWTQPLLIATLTLLAPTTEPTSQPSTTPAQSRFEGEWPARLLPPTDSGDQPFADKLVFKDGNFYSEHFRALGHEPESFVERKEKLPETFGGPTSAVVVDVNSKGKGGDTLKWHFTYAPPYVKGTLEWTQIGAAEVHKFDVVFDAWGEPGF